MKTFDLDLKNDKDKGFRVDRIIDSILQLVYSYELVALRELWSHFDQRMFSKLEQDYIVVVKKLEHSVLKLYVVNAVSNNKIDKVTEFLSKMANELQNQPDWKDWYTLPYIKNPEENPNFSVYFTKQWQDTLLVTLHNFLSLVYQALPQPVLISYEEEAYRVRQLQEENEMLKQKLTTLLEYRQQQQKFITSPDVSHVPPDFVDDFHIIASEIPAFNNADNTVKSLKNLIRTIGVGLPTSPLLGRKTANNSTNPNSSAIVDIGGPRKHLPKQRLTSHPTANVILNQTSDEITSGPTKRSVSLDRENRTKGGVRDSSLDNTDRRNNLNVRQNTNKIPPFLLLSQDSFDGHRTSVTQCKFNSCGSMVASTDTDGVVKIWSPAPSPVLICTSMLKSTIRCLDWLIKNERFVVLGSEEGLLHLYDTKENKIIWETGNENNSPLRDCRVASISSSPTDTSFVCSTLSNRSDHKLLLYDVKTKKLERSLSLNCDPSVYVTCCTHNHNGQLLITGCSDGSVRTFDLRHAECVDQWQAHKGSVINLQLSSDHTLCYTLGMDDKLCRRSLNASNQGPTWDAALSNDPMPLHLGHKFALDQTGKHVLMCYGQALGATIFKITNTGLQSVLALKGHKSSPVACDWATANQCCTCVTASVDGKICVSTLLMP